MANEGLQSFLSKSKNSLTYKFYGIPVWLLIITDLWIVVLGIKAIQYLRQRRR